SLRIQISCVPLRSLTNAYCAPVGDQVGSISLRVLLRNVRSGDPSVGATTRSKSVASEANASRAPSGDAAVDPSLPLVTVKGRTVPVSTSAVHRCAPGVRPSSRTNTMDRLSGSQVKSGGVRGPGSCASTIRGGAVSPSITANPVPSGRSGVRRAPMNQINSFAPSGEWGRPPFERGTLSGGCGYRRRLVPDDDANHRFAPTPGPSSRSSASVLPSGDSAACVAPSTTTSAAPPAGLIVHNASLSRAWEWK